MLALLAFRRRTDWLLAVIDLGAAVLVSYVAFVLRFEGEPALPASYRHAYYIGTGIAAVVAVLAGRASGLYRRATLRPGTSNLDNAFATAIITGVVLIVVEYAGLDTRLSRAWIGLVTFGLILTGIGSRGLLRRMRRALVPLGVGLERYAVAGADALARRLVADLTRAAGAPYTIVATLPAGLAPEELAARALRLRVDGLILPAGTAAHDVGHLSAALSGAGVDVLVAPTLADLDMRVASIVTLQGIPLLRVAGVAPRRRAVRRPATGVRHGVAILGTRGIPANYGGFETFAERLALHLVEHGTAVTVYCRRHHATEHGSWRGVRLVNLATIRSKYFDTVVHTALSALHLIAATRVRDVVLCNAANAPVLVLLRLAGRRVVLNVDGLEWRRGKWGIAGRAWYRLGEWLAVRLASVLVTDAEEVRTYYRVRHDSDSVMIPYGADLLDRDAAPLPPQTPVCPDGYALYVSRWERENNPLLVARAQAVAGTNLALVMLGQATYDDALDEQVRAAAAASAVLPGPIYGAGYRALQAAARCYVHATEVGGTHPALVEALGAGNLCLVLDTPENREVAGDAACYFGTADELTGLLRWAAALPAGELAEWRARARAHAAERYSWQAVGEAYLGLLAGERPQTRITDSPGTSA